MDKRLEKTFDENLRDVPVDPIGLRALIQELKQSLPITEEPKRYVSLLGQIGVHLRSLGELEEAHECLLKALEVIKSNDIGIAWEIQQKIRLGHVLQWKREFVLSNELFENIIAVCRSNDEASIYLDFALQHAGKNLFDQRRFQEALTLFKDALALRTNRNAPEDQVESTLMAIKRTKELLRT